MADNQNQKYVYYAKVAWAVYALLALVLACVLVLFVARDNEEMFFYGIMTVAAAYVLRPTDRYIGKVVTRFTGVSPPAEKQ